jgi:hypothetical protein
MGQKSAAVARIAMRIIADRLCISQWYGSGVVTVKGEDLCVWSMSGRITIDTLQKQTSINDSQRTN